MRADRLGAEPAPADWPIMRAMQPRLPRSRSAPRRLRDMSAGSAILHVLVLALLFFEKAGSVKEEQQSAPSFAVQFIDPGLQAPSQAPPQPQSKAQVHLGDEDLPAPPVEQEQPTENVPAPPPLHHYGTARRPRGSSNPFANIVPFDLTPRERHAYASNSNGRSLDLSVGPVVRNGQLSEAVAHVRGSHGLADWLDALRDFVEDHKYYPREAAENGEQGSAVLRVTVTRDGTVKKLELVSSSGSQMLDAAWMAVFRDNKLPPFNDDMPHKEITLPVELDYHLIYGH